MNIEAYLKERGIPYDSYTIGLLKEVYLPFVVVTYKGVKTKILVECGQ